MEDAIDLYGEAILAFQEANDPVGIARGLVGRARVHMTAGTMESAGEDLRNALASAEELGATGAAMEARLGLADFARRTGDLDRASRLYEAQIEWALRHELLEPAVMGCVGATRLALAQGHLHRAHEWVERAHGQLARVSGHWLWATYRLCVAQIMARRANETVTFQWLWSASELGLGDSVEVDIADSLFEIAGAAATHRWPNTLRLAGKLAIAQYERLGQDDRVVVLKDWVST